MTASTHISAFLLTEVDVGSDPARVATAAVPTEDGSGYVLNGRQFGDADAEQLGHFRIAGRTAERGRQLERRLFRTRGRVSRRRPGRVLSSP